MTEKLYHYFIVLPESENGNQSVSIYSENPISLGETLTFFPSLSEEEGFSPPGDYRVARVRHQLHPVEHGKKIPASYSYLYVEKIEPKPVTALVPPASVTGKEPRYSMKNMGKYREFCESLRGKTPTAFLADGGNDIMLDIGGVHLDLIPDSYGNRIIDKYLGKNHEVIADLMHGVINQATVDNVNKRFVEIEKEREASWLVGPPLWLAAARVLKVDIKTMFAQE